MNTRHYTGDNLTYSEEIRIYTIFFKSISTWKVTNS